MCRAFGQPQEEPWAAVRRTELWGILCLGLAGPSCLMRALGPDLDSEADRQARVQVPAAPTLLAPKV